MCCRFRRSARSEFSDNHHSFIHCYRTKYQKIFLANQGRVHIVKFPNQRSGLRSQKLSRLLGTACLLGKEAERNGRTSPFEKEKPWAGSLVCATWGINRLLKALGNCFQCSPRARAYYGNLRACARVNECRPGNDPAKRTNRGGDPLGRTGLL